MEENSLPPGQTVPPSSAAESLDSAGTNVPVSHFSGESKKYPLETLEVHKEGSTGAAQSAYAPTLRSVPFSRRRAVIVSLIITLIVMLITGLSAAFFINKGAPPEISSQLDVPQQDVSVGEESPSLPELEGAGKALLVNGNVIARGNLEVISGDFRSVLRSEQLTGNQTLTLPNTSGTLCLDVNNCNFATQAEVAAETAEIDQQAAELAQQAASLAALQAQLNQIVIPPAGVTSLNNQAGAVSIQGTLNRISVSTANGVVTLTTPQDLDSNANVQFGNLTLGASGRVAANTLQQTAPGNNLAINAGTDSIVFTANGTTFLFPGGGGSQTICTTSGNCGGGGGSVTDVNGLTGSINLQGTTDQVSVATGAGTITFSTPQNINTTSSPTFAALTLTGLGSGNVRVSGGVLTVGAVDLATEVTGALGVGNGGTGLTAAPGNGQMLIGNGTDYTLGTLSNNGGITVTNGAGSIGLAVNYGSLANTAVQGNTTLTCPAGTGNLAGGGNTVTLGAGGACNNVSIVDNPTFSTSVTTPQLILTGTGSNGTLEVASLGQATTFVLPDPGGAAGTICLEELGNCTGSGGITSVNGQTGPGITIANATAAGNTITIQDASTTQKGIAQFSATNFTAVGGVIDTVQNIGITATPQFAGVTLTGNLAMGANSIVGTNFNIDGSTGDITSGLINGQTISSAASFTGTLAVAALGAANSDEVICRNTATNQLATCTSTFATTDDLDGYVQLQAVTPGTAQNGHINVTGTVIGGSFTGSGANLTNLNASNIATGTLNDARLSSNVALLDVAANFTDALQQNGNDVCTTVGNCADLGQAVDSLNGLKGDLTLQGTTGQINVANGADTITLSLDSSVTLQGNTFNGPNQLVQLNASGQLPAVSGALLTDLNGSAITTGTVANARLVNGGALTVSAGNGLSGGGSVALGGTTTLNVVYGSTVNTAVQGNTQITLNAGTNLTGGGALTLGAGGALTVNVADSPTFAGNVTVQGGTVIIGADGQQGLLTLYDGGTGASAFTGTLQVATLGADKTYILPDFAGASASICLTTGNCAGTGGGVTSPGGTTNRLAKFTGGQSIGDSSITDDGSLVSITGNVNLAVQGTNVTVGVGGPGGRTGALVLQNSTNTNTVAIQSGVTGTSYTLTLPTAVGSADQCLKAQDGTGTLVWADCLGGGGGGITSINGQTGPGVTIANASGAGNVITIQDASTSQKGIAQFNATNFTATGGTINTIQDIHTGATPTFAGLTLNGNLNLGANDISGTNFSVDGATGDVTSGLINGQTISSSANFTGTVSVATGITSPLLQSTGAMSITPGGTLTVGATGQTLTLQGNASTTLSATGGGFTTTVGFAGVPTGNVTYNFDRSATTGTYEICSTAGNCSGLGNAVDSLNGLQGDLTLAGTAGQIDVSNGADTITLSLDSAVTLQGNTFNGPNQLVQLNASGQLPAVSGALLTNLNASALTTGTVDNARLVNGGALTVTAGTGLSGGGSVALGGTTTLNVTYGNTASTAVEGNTQLTVTAGTNLNGGGTITLGDGGSVTVNVADSPVFAGTGTFQGGSVTIGTSGPAGTTGSLILQNATNANTVSITSGATSTSYALTLPTTVGLANQCLKAQDGTGTLFWDDCLGGGGGGGISSVNGQTGPAITINNASGASNAITIDDAGLNTIKGIATFDSDNFIANSGLINTVQDINTSATPTFGGLSLNGNLDLGTNTIQGTTAAINFTNFDVLGNGNTTIGGTLGVAGAGTFSSTLAVQGGSVTVGAAALQGSLILNDGNGGQTGTLSVANLAANRTYTLPEYTTGTGAICLDSGNCAGAGGGVTTAGGTTNRLAVFTGGQAVGDSWFLQNSSTLELDATRNLSLLGGDLSVTGNGSFTGNQQVDGNTTLGNAASDTLTVNAASNFNTDVDMLFNDSENLSISGTISGSTSVSVWNMSIANNTSSGTQNLALLQNAGGTGVTDALLVLDNADADTAVGAGIVVTSAAGSITTGIDVSDADIVNALLFGANDIIGTNFNVVGGTGTFTSVGNGNIQGGILTLGTTSQAGSVLFNDGSSNTGTLQVAALNQNTVYTLPDPGGASATICLSTGNCAGAGTGITGSGTANRLAVFDGAQNVVDSWLLQNGSTLALDNGRNLAVNTNTLFVDAVSSRVGVGTATPGTALDVSGRIRGSEALELQQSSIAQGTFFNNSNSSYIWVDNDGRLNIQGRSNSTRDIRFITRDGSGASAIRMFIHANTSNIGIGDVSNTPQARLDVGVSNASTTASTARGSLVTVNDTGVVTTGTDTNYGQQISVSRTGATGGTINTYGLDIQATGDNAGAGTHTITGLNVNVSGAADARYAAILQGGNVGIGDADPQHLLTVGTGDAFGVNSTGAIAAATGITSSGNITFSGLANCSSLQTNGAGLLSCGAGGSGVTTIGTIDSQTKSANGAVISGSSLVLQTADSGFPGLVSTGTQTFAGEKTFTGAVTTFTGDIALNGGDLTSDGALNITPGGALTLGVAGQAATLQGSTTTITSNGAGNDITLNSADQIMLNSTGGLVVQNSGTAVASIDTSGKLRLVSNGYTATGIDAGIRMDSTITKNAFATAFYAFDFHSTINVSADPSGLGTDFLFRDWANRNINATSGALVDNGGHVSFAATPTVAGTGNNNSTISGVTGVWTSPTLNKTGTGTHTATNVYGVQSGAIANANTIMGTRYGIKVENVTGSGTVNNQYGLHINDLTKGANNYGVYIQGASTYALWVDSGATRLDGTLEVQTLGSTDAGNNVLCRNSSNQLAACSATFASASSAFVNGGNDFGGNAILGTNAAGQSLLLKTAGTTRLTIGTTGNATLTGNLTVQGTGISSTAGTFGINNVNAPNRLSVNTLATADAAAQVGVSTNGAANKGVVIQGVTSQTANLLETKNVAGTVTSSIAADGSITTVADLNVGDDATITGQLGVGMAPMDSYGITIQNVGGTTPEIFFPSENLAHISSNSGFVFQVDANNNSGNTIDVVNGTGNTVFQVFENGAITAGHYTFVSDTDTGILSGAGTDNLLHLYTGGITRLRVSDNGVTLGAGGTEFGAIKMTTVSWAPGSTAAGATTTTNIDTGIEGAVIIGVDPQVQGFTACDGTGCAWRGDYGFLKQGDTTTWVTLSYHNTSTGPKSPGSTEFRIWYIQE